MNHEKIAFQALRYRSEMVEDSYTAGRFDAASTAKLAVECGDPAIDSAIRIIGTIWVRFGFIAEDLMHPWDPLDLDPLVASDPAFLDAIDDIIRACHRVRFSRPRRGSLTTQPRHRPGYSMPRR